MKALPLAAGWLGVILAIVAVVGRFMKQPSITLLGHSFQAQSILILANTFLLFAIFLHLMGRKSDV